MNNYTTSAKRKLLAQDVMNEVVKLRELGVPLNTIIRNKELQISRPLLKQLLQHYQTLLAMQAVDGTMVETYVDSLFPEWLDITNNQPQQQPDGWSYSGMFPLGEWIYLGDTK